MQILDLYMVFVDLTKAFDIISRYGLWQILRKIGCPDLFVDIIRSFHEGMVARVQLRSRTNVGAILGNKWYQARLCDGTTVIHISILSHAQ